MPEASSRTPRRLLRPFPSAPFRLLLAAALGTASARAEDGYLERATRLSRIEGDAELELLRTKAGAPGSERERALAGLSLARAALGLERAADADASLRKIGAAGASPLRGAALSLASDPLIFASINLTRAQTRLALNDAAGALVLLDDQAAESVPPTLAPELRLVRFRAALAAGLYLDALQSWRRAGEEIETRTDSIVLEAQLLRLAGGLAGIDEKKQADVLYARLARLFPASPASVRALEALTADRCSEGHYLADPHQVDARRRLVLAEMLRKVGPLPDVRAFLLAAAGIDEDKITPKRPASELDADGGIELLDTAEFLMGIREYGFGYQLLNYLRPVTQRLGNRFPRDRFLFALGRAANNNQDAKAAASAYRELSTKYPRSRFAGSARSRYALSLQYGGDFAAAAAVHEINAKSARRGREAFLLKAMWNRYLAKDYLAAEKHAKQLLASRGLSAGERATVSYWKARAGAQRGETEEAKSSLAALGIGESLGAAPIFSRWHLEGTAGAGAESLTKVRVGQAQAPEPEESTAAFQARALSGLFSPTEDAPADQAKVTSANPEMLRLFPLTAQFLSAGLPDLARLGFAQEMSKQQLSKMSASELSLTSVVARRVQNYRVLSFVGRRLSAAVSPALRDEASLARSIAENRDAWRANYPLAYWPLVQEAAKVSKVDPFLVLGIMRAESNYDPAALSEVGARGLLQIMAFTGFRIAETVDERAFRPETLTDPAVNIPLGAAYLRRLLSYYKENEVLAIAAYNAGPAAVDRWLSSTPDLGLDEFAYNIPFDQTRNYVNRVLENLDFYQRIYSVGGKGYRLAHPSQLPRPVQGMEMF